MNHRLRSFGLKIKNYKCFSSDPQGFADFARINVLVGKNNTGKTSCLGMLKYATKNADISSLGRAGNLPNAIICKKIILDDFQHSNVMDAISNQYGVLIKTDELINKTIRYNLTRDDNNQLYIDNDNEIFIDESPYRDLFSDGKQQECVKALCRTFGNPFSQFKIAKISSDRDIVFEADKYPLASLTESLLNTNGEGATTIFQRLLNNDRVDNVAHPYEIIQDSVLPSLNIIYSDSIEFEQILVKRRPAPPPSPTSIPTEEWEIYLKEVGSRPYPLSETGSGLKTVLLVLLYLFILPKYLFKISLDRCFFAFEELENNLHPSIQRNLLKFLRNFSINNDCYLLLTTHSNVIMNYFDRDPEAQIFHIAKSTDGSTIRPISTYLHSHNILHDLDVRASDLLQSNVIVWVEGPSDRIYFNRWVELWDGEIKEGTHYQCLFTAGRLLENFTFERHGDGVFLQSIADDAELATNEFIEAIKINRNVIIVMDKDVADNQELKPWVNRIVGEVMRAGGMAWVTKGCEIENYLPVDAVNALVVDKIITSSGNLDETTRFSKVLYGPQGGDLSKSKPFLATTASKVMTRKSLASTLDLSEKLSEACKLIRKWNGLPEIKYGEL